jgi:hypothetical protein
MQKPYLPQAPREYDYRYMDQLTLVLSRFFRMLDTRQPLRASTLNFDLETLPTDADLADLALGDVYRDTTASNVLKVKV